MPNGSRFLTIAWYRVFLAPERTAGEQVDVDEGVSLAIVWKAVRLVDDESNGLVPLGNLETFHHGGVTAIDDGGLFHASIPPAYFYGRVWHVRT